MSITLREDLRKGESETLEFKQGVPSEPSLAAILAGFANTRGGLLYLGVADDGQIVGLSPENEAEAIRRLTAVADSLLSFADARVQIGTDEDEGRRVVWTRVWPVEGGRAPVLTATGALYLRHGSTTTRLSEGQRDAKLEENVEPTPQLGDEITVFVAMSFRVEEEPHLVDYFAAMERAAVASGGGVHLTRVDLLDDDFEISQQIMDCIDAADVVLADFTLSPHNVYFEAGYARGAGKPIIQTARAGTRLEFDVRNWSTIFYRNARELEERLTARFRRLSSKTDA